MYEIHESAGSIYLVMELCTGGAIIYRKNQTFTQEVIQGVLLGVLHGLAYMSRLDIVHRDLKPFNILYKVPLKQIRY